METQGFVHRLVSWSGTALYVASTFALVSLCWSGGDVDSDSHVLTDRARGVGTGGSTVDDNVSGPSVDAEPLFQSSQKIANGKRWIAAYIVKVSRVREPVPKRSLTQAVTKHRTCRTGPNISHFIWTTVDHN